MRDAHAQALFGCLVNAEMFTLNFEIPIKSGMAKAFLDFFLDEPETFLDTPSLISYVISFTGLCVNRMKSREFDQIIAQKNVPQYARLMLDDAPESQFFAPCFAHSRSGLDDLRTIICSVLIRLVDTTHGIAVLLHREDFFGRLLRQMNVEPVTLILRGVIIDLISLVCIILTPENLRELPLDLIADLFQAVRTPESFQNTYMLMCVVGACLEINRAIPENAAMCAVFDGIVQTARESAARIWPKPP
jgi:hypothetical protein